MRAVETPWVQVAKQLSSDAHSLRIQVSVNHEQAWCCYCGETQYLVCSGDAQAMLAGEEQIEIRLESEFRSLHSRLMQEWHSDKVPPFPRLPRSRRQRAQCLQEFLLGALASAARMGDEKAEMDPV